MSEPMSSVEIEDVLSSIRRLVSEELRPVQRMAPVAQASGAKAPAGGGRLLLTPALRVVPGRAEPDATPDPTPQGDSVLEALLGQLAGRPADEAEALPDPAEDAAAPRGGAASVEALFAAMGTRIPDAEFEPEPDVALRPAAKGEVEADDLAVEEAMAAVAAAVPGWPRSEVMEVDLDAVDEAEVIEVEGDEAGEIDGENVEALRLSEAWRDGAWPLEPAPADAARLDSAPEAALDADQAEAAAVAEILAADQQAAQAAPEPDLLGEEDFLIDEEVMRALVRDIIREELQGALGERITRNVRKLVRAEIHRTLLSRDLG
ncbi:hypothetical protein SAMN04488103_105234 [Gemmobacter aquatilis]|uniref:Uncharacterized protein n=1 Tax=Gemmobacter aquatilis TaxID=933059 RepID=A0A1H8H239_9RHOB|nr:hypothetical protein [Gemmobacter aquatilis]SEN50306.1 hypothetical protein SAMN04488103_105234 [Gemmobacter aquatilis]